MNKSTKPANQIIAEQNDRFRINPLESGVPGRIVCTPGISALSPDQQMSVMIQVTKYDSFTEDNDPHGEHDFGAFDLEDVGKIFWKIDYYDADYHCGSEDPSDLEQTRRVLTVMLAEEY